MSDKSVKEPKERILECASQLFAQRGFSAVGVREIATNADVNISMVSYYYNGKTGILKAIIDEYFNEVKNILKTISETSFDPETSLKFLIREMMKLFNERHDLCKVAIIELPFDQEDVSEFKIRMFNEHIKLIKQTFHAHSSFFDNPAQTMIIVLAFLSLLFSNLVFGNVIRDSSKIVFDDEYYERYIDLISTLFLRGIIGVASSNKLKQAGDSPDSGENPHQHPHSMGQHPHSGHPHSGHPHSGHPHSGHPHSDNPHSGEQEIDNHPAAKHPTH